MTNPIGAFAAGSVCTVHRVVAELLRAGVDRPGAPSFWTMKGHAPLVEALLEQLRLWCPNYRQAASESLKQQVEGDFRFRSYKYYTT